MRGVNTADALCIPFQIHTMFRLERNEKPKCNDFVYSANLYKRLDHFAQQNVDFLDQIEVCIGHQPETFPQAISYGPVNGFDSKEFLDILLETIYRNIQSMTKS